MDGSWRMASGSKTVLEACLGAGAPIAFQEVVVLAVLEHRDFDRARTFIEGFDRWDSLDDFICERDGLHIGLSSGGLQVHLAAVSIRAFEQWTAHSGITPSVQALDEFAARVRAFRLNPELPVESSPTADWSGGGREHVPRGGRFTIPIAPLLYSSWRDSLGRLGIFFPSPSVDAYARILIDSWVEAG